MMRGWLTLNFAPESHSKLVVVTNMWSLHSCSLGYILPYRMEENPLAVSYSVLVDIEMYHELCVCQGDIM